MDVGPRTDRHPRIHFPRGMSGARRPALVGTRLYVWQIVDTVRASAASVPDAADYLQLPESHVRAAIDYYADYADEVDAYRIEEQDFERRDRARRVLE